MLHSGLTRLTTEGAEKDKNTSEEPLNRNIEKIPSHWLMKLRALPQDLRRFK